MYSLADPAAPGLVQTPVPVDVGPFSGVAAAGGLVILSGGTSLLSLRRYNADGLHDSPAVTADLGRGQPDVTLAQDGRHAFVSVHDEGPLFSLVVLRLAQQPLAAREIARLRLATYGFTPGGARPASFPIEMATLGETLLIASAAGLQVIDVRDPANPRSLATLRTGTLPVNVDAPASLPLSAATPVPNSCSWISRIPQRRNHFAQSACRRGASPLASPSTAGR